MHKLINPKTISGSPSYSHGVEVQNPVRWLFVAGQVGRDAEGNVPDGIEAQAEIAWGNLAKVLDEAGMTFDDIADMTIYLTNRDDNAGFDRVRSKWIGNARPASTKIYVSGLAHPKMLCEVQVLAAK